MIIVVPSLLVRPDLLLLALQSKEMEITFPLGWCVRELTPVWGKDPKENSNMERV